jgi:hypothetical protein
MRDASSRMQPPTHPINSVAGPGLPGPWLTSLTGRAPPAPLRKPARAEVTVHPHERPALTAPEAVQDGH